MRKLPVFLAVFLLSIGLGIIGCGEDDSSPTGPTLAAPSSLTATVTSVSTIALVWTDAEQYALGYRVERATGGSTFSQITELENGEARAFTDTGLSEGTTYAYRVRSYSRTADSPYSAAAEGTTPLIAPTRLTAARVSTTEIAITWTENSQSEENVEVQRSLRSADGYETISTLAADVVTFNDTELEPDTKYYYKVRVTNGDIISAWSNTANAITEVFTPDVPEEFAGEPHSSSSIYLTWDDKSSDEDGFVVEMRETMDAAWEEAARLEPNYRSYLLEGLTSSTVYYFRLYAYNEYGNSAYSDEISVETQPGPPLPPTDFAAEAPDFSQVILSWTDNSSDEIGFVIERAYFGTTQWTEVTRTAADVETYNDTDVEALRVYNYRMASFNDVVQNRGLSPWVTVNGVQMPEGPPTQPAGLIATMRSSSQINLTWTDAANNETGFIVQQSLTEDGDWTHTDSLGEGTVEYLAGNLAAETTYYFRVTCFNQNGNSRFSNVAFATTLPNPPEAPTNLSAEAPDSRMAVLSWTDNSDNEASFILERRPIETNDWMMVARLDPDAVAYDDEDVYPTLSYDYRIRATNIGGDSEWSDIATVRIPDGPPHAPGNLAGQAIALEKIQLGWIDRSISESGFILERRLADQGNFRPLYETGTDTTTFLDEELTFETEYEYRVLAYREDNGWQSEYSNVLRISTWPLLALYDGFEDYRVDSRPNSLNYRIDRGGSSDLVVTDEDFNGGEKSLKFIDTAMDDSYVRWTVSHTPVETGFISCWMRIAPQAMFGLIGADANDIITFQIQFNSDNTIFQRNGGALEQGPRYVADEWIHVVLDFDFISHTYNITFNDQIVSEGLNLQNQDLKENSQLIFLAFSDATLNYLYLDDLEIRHVVKGEDSFGKDAGQDFSGSNQTITDFRTLRSVR